MSYCLRRISWHVGAPFLPWHTPIVVRVPRTHSGFILVCLDPIVIRTRQLTDNSAGTDIYRSTPNRNLKPIRVSIAERIAANIRIRIDATL